MSSLPVKVTTSLPAATSKDWDAYELVTNRIKLRISPKSWRVYEDTFNKWAAYCERKNIHPLSLTDVNVSDFLRNDPVGLSTRRRELSNLRHVAEVYANISYTNPAVGAMYSALMRIKVPTENMPTRERRKRALGTEEIKKAIAVWDEKNFGKTQTLLVARNRAMIALMFATGIRRDEVSKLMRQDINLEDFTLLVRHGKGDKPRNCAIVDTFWMEPLKAWMALLGDDRKYLFPPMLKNKIGEDKPTDNESAYRAVKTTERLSGIGMSPHDLRRTFANRTLSSKKRIVDGVVVKTDGAKLKDVQAQMGHANPSTTLIYDAPVDAKERRETLTLGID